MTNVTTTTDAQYGEFEAGEGVVIYDLDNHRAWVQSDATVEVAAMT